MGEERKKQTNKKITVIIESVCTRSVILGSIDEYFLFFSASFFQPLSMDCLFAQCLCSHNLADGKRHTANFISETNEEQKKKIIEEIQIEKY